MVLWKKTCLLVKIRAVHNNWSQYLLKWIDSPNLISNAAENIPKLNVDIAYLNRTPSKSLWFCVGSLELYSNSIIVHNLKCCNICIGFTVSHSPLLQWEYHEEVKIIIPDIHIELSSEEVIFRCECEWRGVGCFRESRITYAQIKQSAALVYITGACANTLAV